jgi:hypothetical protein
MPNEKDTKSPSVTITLSRNELDRILLWWELFREGCWIDLQIAEKLSAEFVGREPTNQLEYESCREQCAKRGCLQCATAQACGDVSAALVRVTAPGCRL